MNIYMVQTEFMPTVPQPGGRVIGRMEVVADTSTAAKAYFISYLSDHYDAVPDREVTVQTMHNLTGPVMLKFTRVSAE